MAIAHAEPWTNLQNDGTHFARLDSSSSEDIGPFVFPFHVCRMTTNGLVTMLDLVSPNPMQVLCALQTSETRRRLQ